MKKRTSININFLLVLLFCIYTISVLIIVYTDFDNPHIYKFVIGYLVFCFLFLIYFIIMSIKNMRKLTWVEIRKRLLKFIILLFLFSISNYIFNNGFRLVNTDIFKGFSSALGVAAGLAFFDLAFSGKKKN